MLSVQLYDWLQVALATDHMADLVQHEALTKQRHPNDLGTWRTPTHPHTPCNKAKK